MDYLGRINYVEFLRQYGGLGDEATQLFNNACHPSWGVEMRSLSAAEALDDGMPGLNLLGQKAPSGGWDYPVAMFPDGNAGLARPLLQTSVLLRSSKAMDKLGITGARCPGRIWFCFALNSSH